jgi:hypothetical protein
MTNLLIELPHKAVLRTEWHIKHLIQYAAQSKTSVHVAVDIFIIAFFIILLVVVLLK